MNIRFNEVMSCQVYQHKNSVSASQGPYFDLKSHPEQAADLPEATEWPAFGRFIAAINECNGFATSGCLVNGATRGGHNAPYADLYLDHPWTVVSGAARTKLVNALLELNDYPGCPSTVIEICKSAAQLPSGESIMSVRLWFIGERADAEHAFGVVLAKLHEQNISDYLPIAERDYRFHKQANIRLAISTSVWASVVAISIWFAAPYGWTIGIAGAIAGLLAVPLAFFACAIVSSMVYNWRHKA